MNSPRRLIHKALAQDLEKLASRAFYRAENARPTLLRYHSTLSNANASHAAYLRFLYGWMFVPLVLWPFNVQDVLDVCLTSLENAKPLSKRYRLLLELLPEPPCEAICAAVAEHELNIQRGAYENLVRTQAKYAQADLAMRSNPDLHEQWTRLKVVFDVDAYRDHKGVVRRTMGAERNLRPSFSVNPARRDEVFRAVFDAFCLRWNLYGMQHDEPLLLKLAVNITAYGTMIYIPSYWSFDPKRDIRWDAVARLHRVRVPRRQGPALTEGFAARIEAAKKLQRLDKEALRMGLKGDKKHEFLCSGLGWDTRTSARRVSRLRAEAKRRVGAKKGE